MGNTTSNVASGVKQQGSSESKQIYNLMDLKGKGELVEMMKFANLHKNYDKIDQKILELKKFFYNNGEGKLVPIKDLIIQRNKERGGLPITNSKQKQTKMKSTKVDSFVLFNVEEQHKNSITNGSKMRHVCWDLNERGTVGENILHLCLLNATSIHADIAKRLLQVYPKLVNDIYTSEEYYGEIVLHMAIVNEDPAMVKFLLDRGADCNQRCYGNFFCPDDQRNSRTDTFEHEHVNVCLNTNYEGYTYWGEYSLGFAACLGQEECVRLLLAKGADPNLQDSNGNTVMHMMVIHDKKEMFDLLVDFDGKLNIKNHQGLTPLTLAAKLARKDMYDHILDIERNVLWIYGNVTCAGYPLEGIDSISTLGKMNTISVLHLIVYGDKPAHLDMIDGLVVNLLKEKWKTYAKTRFIRRFLGFALYFLIFLMASIYRPGTDTSPTTLPTNFTENGQVVIRNITQIDPCYMLRSRKNTDIVRFVFEILTLLGACLYLFLSMNEIYHQGVKIFFETLRSAPAKAMFLLSCCFVILMVPGRAACAYVYEDILAVFAILLTAQYFLFFCRGLKIVGPFVVMIYKMVTGDLLRFFIIYLIFVIGFSQAMFVLFLGVEDTMFAHPVEAMMGMFIMSLGEFKDIYDSFDQTKNHVIGKTIFLGYMVLATILLINMLIAMMGNTYTMVNETQKEWLRQWAHIVLVVEQTLTTDERIEQQKNYSLPMKNGGRALEIKWYQSEEEKLEKLRLRELHRVKTQILLQKKRDGRSSARKPINILAAMDGKVNV